MMSSTCIVRTAVVRKPGLSLGLVSFGLRLGLKNLVLFTPSLLFSILPARRVGSHVYHLPSAQLKRTLARLNGCAVIA